MIKVKHAAANGPLQRQLKWRTICNSSSKVETACMAAIAAGRARATASSWSGSPVFCAKQKQVLAVGQGSLLQSYCLMKGPACHKRQSPRSERPSTKDNEDYLSPRRSALYTQVIPLSAQEPGRGHRPMMWIGPWGEAIASEVRGMTSTKDATRLLCFTTAGPCHSLVTSARQTKMDSHYG
jgi:hypothetical protein